MLLFRTRFEESHGKPIYAVEFCNCLQAGEPIIFATCGSNRVNIYECQTGGEIALLQCYSDAFSDEEYYACCWSFDPNNLKPILAVGGLKKIIRIISPTTVTSNKHFMGHGDAIYEIKAHPKNPSLLLSASKDNSVRLWNIQTDVCVAIFGGAEGHMTEVLSCDFDTTGDRIATGGMDNTVRVWNLNQPTVQSAIDESSTFDRNENRYAFKTVIEQFPDHSVDNIHSNYVDCVKWIGNLIFSKVSQFAVCWLLCCCLTRKYFSVP